MPPSPHASDESDAAAAPSGDVATDTSPPPAAAAAEATQPTGAHTSRPDDELAEMVRPFAKPGGRRGAGDGTGRAPDMLQRLSHDFCHCHDELTAMRAVLSAAQLTGYRKLMRRAPEAAALMTAGLAQVAAARERLAASAAVLADSAAAAAAAAEAAHVCLVRRGSARCLLAVTGLLLHLLASRCMSCADAQPRSRSCTAHVRTAHQFVQAVHCVQAASSQLGDGSQCVQAASSQLGDGSQCVQAAFSQLDDGSQCVQAAFSQLHSARHEAYSDLAMCAGCILAAW